MPVHEGHRSRKKEQFRAHGLDAFADHEVLELLLYYAVPRQDTNPIAHRLMEKFGSLDAVFAADRAAVEEVEGIGENASTLISLMFPLMRRIRASSGAHEAILSDTEQAGAYFLDLFLGEREEKLYEACLDAKGRLLACHLVPEGDAESVQHNLRKIVAHAPKSGARSVHLDPNHPTRDAPPSPPTPPHTPPPPAPERRGPPRPHTARPRPRRRGRRPSRPTGSRCRKRLRLATIRWTFSGRR
mgnify:CR=1 FL=1